MIDNILVVAHGTIVLLFGVFLSGAFSGVKFNKKNILVFTALSAVCGLLQILFVVVSSVESVYMLYPFITHLPMLLLLCLYYRKKFATALAAVCTAYLCCQPSKWFGILAFYLTDSQAVNYIVRIVVLIVSLPLIVIYFAPVLSNIFSRDKRSIYIFNIAPLVYYFYDYITVIYTDLLIENNIIATEFMPFFLLVVYLVLCLLYHSESQQKSAAERKEHIIQITVDEQKKELDAIKKSEQEIRLIRHDMRLLLNNLSVCIDNSDNVTAKKMISSYIESIDNTTVKKYCANTTLNYIISSFDEKCRNQNIEFTHSVNISTLDCDEIMFSTILSNALDNAVNAQQFTAADRKIDLMIKQHNGKMLMSVKNTFYEKPVFTDGVPVSDKKDHGYGTQSIVYLTERMGGNYQFTTEGNWFVLNVVI